MDLARPERFQPLDLGALLICIKIEMDAGRKDALGRMCVERYVWSVPGTGVEQSKVDVHGLAQ